jgi:hypothetical protein
MGLAFPADVHSSSCQIILGQQNRVLEKKLR